MKAPPCGVTQPLNLKCDILVSKFAAFQWVNLCHYTMHFAQLLGQREHADYYWRITKDDNQHSHIECENIYE